MQIESIWVDIQFYNDQNPKIAVYRKNTTYTRPRRFAKKKQTKKTPWTIYNLQNDQAVYKYISTIVEKLLDRIFAVKVMWHEGERYVFLS